MAGFYYCIIDSNSMQKNYTYRKNPDSRIASLDVLRMSKRKNHIAAMLEVDVTLARERIKILRRSGSVLGFNSWLISVIAKAVNQQPLAAAFLSNSRKILVFEGIHVSILVEKKMEGQKVPLPMVIENAERKSPDEIAGEIDAEKNKIPDKREMVLNRKRKRYEMLYYHLPGFIRRLFWSYILSNPKTAYKLMGNVVITTPGMMGRINGWFIQKSIHPLSFGIGSVVKKPIVIGKEIAIREVLQLTILLDHDVIDGAPMVRFLNDFIKLAESADGLRTGTE